VFKQAFQPPQNEGRKDIRDKINHDLKLYHKAFAPMTRRNLLTTLQQSIKQWTDAQSQGTFSWPMWSLNKVVEKKLAELSPERGYTHVQCVAWKVGSGDRGKYYATSTNDRLDMMLKCAKMKRAINKARDSLQNRGDNESTLKVFMAPEFYFRGAGGAYSSDVVFDIVEEMMKGDNDPYGTKHANFKDWLFIFGTAVCAFEHETGLAAEIHNVALIQKEDDVFTVAKEFISGVDYQKNSQGKVEVTVSDNDGAKKKLPVTPPQGSSQCIGSRFDDERMGGCIFTVDGITFGLEVCMDHAASHGQAGQGRLSNQCESIQVLLIPSWGMSIGTGMYCKPNGIVFNVDGRQITGGPQPSAEVRVRDMTPDAPKPETPYTPLDIDGSISFFGPFALPPKG
jgi:hypothetical protein